MGYTRNDMTTSSQTLDVDTYRHRNTFRQTGQRHALTMEADITSLFRWGGADLFYADRGTR